MARFGDDTAGGDTFPCSGDRALLSLFTLTEAGDLSEIVARFDASSTAGASIKGLVYANSAGTPGARLAVGAAVAVPAGGGLVSSALSVSLAAGDYWLGFVANSFEAVAQCDSAGGLSRMEGTTYASPAATWTQSGTSAARVNVYAEYTAAPTGPTLLFRQFPPQRVRGGKPLWIDPGAGGVLARYEFFGPEVTGPTLITISARSSEAGIPRSARALTVARLAPSTDLALPRNVRTVRATRAAASSEGASPRAAAAPLAPGVITVTARSSEAGVPRSARSLRIARAAPVIEPTRSSSARSLSVSRTTRSAEPSQGRSAYTYRFQRTADADAVALPRSARAVIVVRAAASAEAGTPRGAAAPVVAGVITTSARSSEAGIPRGPRSVILGRSAAASDAPRAAAVRLLRALRAARATEPSGSSTLRSVRVGRAAAAWDAAGVVVQRLLRALRGARSDAGTHARSNAARQAPITKGYVTVSATARTAASLSAERRATASAQATVRTTTTTVTAADVAVDAVPRTRTEVDTV